MIIEKQFNIVKSAAEEGYDEGMEEKDTAYLLKQINKLDKLLVKYKIIQKQ